MGRDKMHDNEDDQHISNTVVASPRVIGEGNCQGFSTYMYPVEFIDFILSESATMIYLPYIEVDLFSSDMENLSKIAKNHISIIDNKKTIFKEIKEIVASISDEVNYSKNKENYLDYELDRLLQFLYHVRLAREYESEADVSRIYDLKDDLLHILDNTNNKEVRTLLSEILGFFNCYSAQSVGCNALRANLQSNIVNEKFSQIMLDSQFLNLSNIRYKLNKNRNYNLIPEINISARKIAMSKEYKKILKLLKIPLYICTPNNLKYKYDLIKSNLSSFSPSLIDLDAIAHKAVYETITKKKWNRYAWAEEEVYVVPWSIYDLPGEPIFRDK
jgi:hypothetical protein